MNPTSVPLEPAICKTGLPRGLDAMNTLAWREVVRFLRQRNRVIGALATPLMFWVLLGCGIGSSFQNPGSPGQGYFGYFFPGTILLVVMFTAIFSTISIIEDRREGFLQGVLVSPSPRWSLVLGKILGGSAVALLQATLLLLLAPLAGYTLTFGSFALLFIVLSIASVGMTGLGYWIAWQMNSVQGFHAIMNLFLMPLWMLSGALFPASGASTWLSFVMPFNPLYYGNQALFLLLQPNRELEGPSLALCFVVLTLFALGMIIACSWISKRDRTETE